MDDRTANDFCLPCYLEVENTLTAREATEIFYRNILKINEPHIYLSIPCIKKWAKM